MKNIVNTTCKKKKIAIITLNGYSNFGNRFQNFALQQTLKSYADRIDTLLIRDGKKKEHNFQSSLLYTIKKNLKSISYHDFMRKGLSVVLFRVICYRHVKNKRRLRYQAFVAFSEKFISEIDSGLTHEFIPTSLEVDYDYFIVGSDQVWNPLFPEFSELFFLTFAPKQKRIAYAPSFGINELPERFNKDFTSWIMGFDHLSVREKLGAEIIMTLTGRDVPVVLDPTMLLTKEDWLNASEPVGNIPKKPYIFIYFLGVLDPKINKEIKRFAKEQHMQIVRINDITSKFYAIGPSEFITLLDQASLVLTDSFHGTVFSIIFEKPFLTYKRIGRNDMYSRIETLFSLLHLQGRKDMSLSDPNLLKIDYTEVIELLQIERTKAIDYLSGCFAPNK
jgi:hypothetical protein